MLHRSFLLNRVVNSLLAKRFEVFLSSGCFDIAAKREKLVLIKTLMNVDGLAPQRALSLRAASYFLSAYPFVISMKTNRGLLSSDVVYSRFDLPVVTPDMFDNIIEEQAYEAYAAKGRHTVAIDVSELRRIRNSMGFTLKELSQLIGISKKALYEIENERVRPTRGTVERIECTLNVKLRVPYKLRETEPTYVKPMSAFQSRVSRELMRIGIANSPVHGAPFELVGRESFIGRRKRIFSMITSLSKNSRKIKRDAPKVRRLSAFFSTQAFFIAKHSDEQAVDGVPVLLEDELPEVESARELKKLIEEKQ